MSTGANCYFYEEKPNQWFYKIQEWPYGEWPEYETNGPFKTFEQAEAHLERNYANPGGYSVREYKAKS
jgi:hypothetical protein